MKIINLYAENLKRLTAVQIEPDGNLVQITGRNGQGKTSVLDAIWWALDGTKNVQTTPIRKGEERAIVQLDLGELKITRRFNAQDDGGYTTSITVENGEGARFSSPQTMLDKLLGELTFDPLMFTRMKDRDQVLAMRSLVPDFDFDEAEQIIKDSFAKRTDENRKAKEAQSAAETLSKDLPEETPERVAFSDLSKEWNDANLHNSSVDAATRDRENLKQRHDNLTSQILDLQDQIEGCKEAMSKLGEPQEKIDIDQIRERMDKTEANNKIADNAEKRDGHLKTAKEAQQISDNLTNRMNRIKKDAQEAIASADMPVSGLSIQDGAVYLDDVPFNQASDAQQLQASIGIAMALNPQLKVIRVRDGSLLDEDAMKTLSAMADEHDYQIWIERVDSSGTIGFVLEDGHLKGQAIAQEAEEKTEPNTSQTSPKTGASLFDSDRA